METPHHTTHTQSPHIMKPTTSTTTHQSDITNSKSADMKFNSRYEWVGKDDTIDYMRSIKKWREHTNSDYFAREFDDITEKYKDDNEQRTGQIESFLIREAIKTGVVREVK